MSLQSPPLDSGKPLYKGAVVAPTEQGAELAKEQAFIQMPEQPKFDQT